MNRELQTLSPIAFIGPGDSAQRFGTIIRNLQPGRNLVVATYRDGWPVVLEAHPDILLIEIGLAYDDRTHLLTRRLLEQARERWKNDLYVAVILTSPERLLFGGDLLFQRGDSLESAGLVDTFLALPPAEIAPSSDLFTQLQRLFEFCTADSARRAQGGAALPHLNAPFWAQSFADPESRDLWSRWLPRAARYNNENPIIVGETGTGKTNFARALHEFSGRPGEFVSITPRDFSSSELVQAELFGAVSGAYTGAVDKWGLVKRAERGTLFIDELQSIDKDLQGKLITFIENKFYRRVGSTEPIAANVRFLFASNRSLEEMMRLDILRDDFAYRLERVELDLKPLRERRLDISAALGFALAKVFRQRHLSTPIFGFTSAAYRLLFCEEWPGNLRQLENTVARLTDVAELEGKQLITDEMVSTVRKARLTLGSSTTGEVLARAARGFAETIVTAPAEPLRSQLAKFSDAVRAEALAASAGDTARAQELIGDDPDLFALWQQKRG